MSRRRVTRLARGTGRPGHEPDESGKTDPHPRCAANDAGSGSPRRQRVHPQEGYLGRQRDPLPTRVQGLPPLPAAFAGTLDTGVARLGIHLTPDQRRAVDVHVQLLLAWNEAINLTAIRDPAEIARLHVVDSLSAVPLLGSRGVDRLLDLGTGGGFPGIPLAIALGAEALLVDSVGKKVAFLRAAAEAVAEVLPIPHLMPVQARAEALADGEDRERWPIVTVRAVAALADLVELAFPLLAEGGSLVAWKRGSLDEELRPAERAAEALGGGRIEVHEARAAMLPGHRLVIVDKLGRTPGGWPRDPAGRRRRPW